MRVELITHTPEPEIVCVAAAKLCHEPDDFPVGSTFKGMMDWLREHPDHVKKVLRMCIDRGEGSVIEHATFTFYLEGVSRVLTHELVRHRIASYSQQSQRFVRMDKPTYVRPESLTDLALIGEFDRHMERSWELYGKMTKAGIVRQDARFVLPNACTTKIVCTFNSRSLMNFFNQRCDTHAQWEIRAAATKMLKQVLEVAPNIFYQYEVCEKCGRVISINSIEPALKYLRHGEHHGKDS